MRARLSIIALAAVCLVLEGRVSAFPQLADQQSTGADQGPPPATAKVDDAVPARSAVVTVVRGDRERPVAGIDVVLTDAEGAGRTARSDSTGAARFVDLKPGVSYTVAATVDDVAVRSAEFEVPNAGGVAILLSPTPVVSEGPATGAPDPRQMSGQVRPVPTDPAGTLTVRAIQGALVPGGDGVAGTIPTGALVHLVGIDAGGDIQLQSIEIEDGGDGRASFAGLDFSNRITYYALSSFKRGDGRDLLATRNINMPHQSGLRLFLAGPDARSAEPPVDDYSNLYGTDIARLPPGHVEVRLVRGRFAGSPDPAQVSRVELIDAAAPDQTVATAEVSRRPPDASEIIGEVATIRPLEGTANGQLSVILMRPSRKQPLDGIEVVVRPHAPEGDGQAPEDGAQPGPEASKSHKSGTDGTAYFSDLAAGTRYVVSASFRGKALTSEPFEIDPNGPVSIAFAYEWPDDILVAAFDGVPSGPAHVYVARGQIGERDLFTPPFQLTERRGQIAPLFLYPQMIMAMHGQAELDDLRMWFHANVTLANLATNSYDPGSNGIDIPLPRGFVGASVAEDKSALVKVVPGKGLVWRGPLPSGQESFTVTYALPVDDGRVGFNMNLPFGLVEGSMMVVETPGMTFGGTDLNHERIPRPGEQPRGDGKSFVSISEIERDPGSTLSFEIGALPHPPRWQAQLRLVIGLVVLALLLWAAWASLRSGRHSIALDPRHRSLQRQQDGLLDQVVKLDLSAKRGDVPDEIYEQKRAALVKKLENVYRELRASSGGTDEAPRTE